MNFFNVFHRFIRFLKILKINIINLKVSSFSQINKFLKLNFRVRHPHFKNKASNYMTFSMIK
jgi:hypothetical protein